MLFKRIYDYSDKLELKIRARLSRYPILYAVLGGVGIVLFWRGIWHAADEINLSSIASLLIGAAVLLITGVFVSELIGTKLIMTGLVGEKKIAEKEKGEIETEETQLRNLQNTLTRVEKKIGELEALEEAELQKNLEKKS